MTPAATGGKAGAGVNVTVGRGPHRGTGARVG
jgi:hypothetical protein